jgi:hypothetical protein
MIQCIYHLFGSKQMAEAYLVFTIAALIFIGVAAMRGYIRSRQALNRDRAGR